MKQKIKYLTIGFAITLVTACTAPNGPAATSPAHPEPTIITLSVTPQSLNIPEETSIYTTHALTGNHFVDGTTDLPNATALDIPLDGKPIWLVSAPFKGDIVFVAIMDSGKVQAFKVSGDSYEPFDISPNQLPAGMPPVLVVSEDNIELLTLPNDASLLTSPVIIDSKLVYIGTNGDLVLADSTSQTRLPINALIDSHILISGNNRLLVLTQPTNRYDHGILGDDLEASAITLIETEPELRVAQNILIEAPDVIEGLSPIWADIDNDNIRDIIVTLSNNQSGAQIVAYREDGTLLAQSEPIGLSHRWRHQIAVAQFEPNKPPLLVDVRTPHIGGIVEFFQYNSGKLEIVQTINGFSTHSIGSRNLDSAIAGDFNNDGIIELLAPDQPHISLGIISLDGVIDTFPLDGVLTSNLSAIAIDGKLYISAGTQDNLRIWIP